METAPNRGFGPGSGEDSFPFPDCLEKEDEKEEENEKRGGVSQVYCMGKTLFS